MGDFEKRRCTRCGEEKGGDPYRLCKCQREERGLGDTQPHSNVDSHSKAEEIVNHLLSGKFAKSFSKKKRQ